MPDTEILTDGRHLWLIEANGQLYRGRFVDWPLDVWCPSTEEWQPLLNPRPIPEESCRVLTAVEARRRYGASMYLQAMKDFGNPEIPQPLTLADIAAMIVDEPSARLAPTPKTSRPRQPTGRRPDRT